MAQDTILLYEAIQNDDAAKLKQLISEGTDVNTRVDNTYPSPLYKAIIERSQECAIILIKHGAELQEERYNHCFLHRLATSNCDKVVEWLILEKGYDPNCQHKGLPVLSVSFCPEVAEVLLNHGANLDAKDKIGRTPLHIAAGAGTHLCVRFFIQSGIEVNLQDNNGETALHHALRNPLFNIASVDLLLANGANVNVRSKRGQIPLHCLEEDVYNKHRMIFEILRHDAEIDAQDSDGCSPLHYAVKHPLVVQLYLERGANINLKSNKGETPLALVERRIKEYHQEERWIFFYSLQAYNETSELLLKHIIELREAGLYVSEENLHLAESILSQPDRSNPTLHKHIQNCRLESTRFKLNIGLELNYFLATRDPRYLTNEDLSSKLEKLVEDMDYFVYKKMISHKLEHDRERFRLIDACKSLVVRSKLRPSLPDEMWDEVLSRLTNKDFRVY